MTMTRISKEEALREIESGEAIGLDVRRGSWNRSSVKMKGAIRIPPDDVPSRYNELPKDKKLITYCT